MVGLPLQSEQVDVFGTGTGWQIAGVVAMFPHALLLGGQAGRVEQALASLRSNHPFVKRDVNDNDSNRGTAPL
jgi:hypothetical protein